MKRKKVDKHQALIKWLNLHPKYPISFLFFKTNFRIHNENIVDINGDPVIRNHQNWLTTHENPIKVRIAPWMFFYLFVDNFQAKHFKLFTTARLLEIKAHLKEEIKNYDNQNVNIRFSHRNNLRQRTHHQEFLNLLNNVLLSRKEEKAQLSAILE